jgi:hypothetical protein
MNKITLKTKQGADAIGEFDPATKKVAIKAGSVLTIDLNAIPPSNIRQNIETAKQALREGKMKKLPAGQYEVVADIDELSPSAASVIVTGKGGSGWDKWKLEDGRFLDVLRSGKAGSSETNATAKLQTSMKTINQYKIVQKTVIGVDKGEHFTQRRFEELVNAAIKEDWQPLGGVQTMLKPTSREDPVMVWVQSLVRFMPDLTQYFDDLYRIYGAFFPHSHHTGANLATLEKSVPAERGVYLIWRTHAAATQQDGRHSIENRSASDNLTDKQLQLIYIGCSGKIKKGMVLGAGNVRKRLFGGLSTWTPYLFDGKAGLFQYDPGPKAPSGRPKCYHKSIPINEIEISVIATPNKTAPSALEHWLIQGYINQHGDLPEVNQEI